MYIPLRRPLGNSPTVWESVRSNTTTFALIFLGLWPDWWKKTWLIITFWTNTDDNNKYIPIPNTPYHAMPCQTKVCCLYTQLTKTCILKTPSQPQLSQNTATCTSLHAPHSCTCIKSRVGTSRTQKLQYYYVINIILFFPFWIKVCSRTNYSLHTYTLRFKFHPQSPFSPYQSTTETRTDIKWEGQSKTMPKKTIMYTIQKPQFSAAVHKRQEFNSSCSVKLVLKG